MGAGVWSPIHAVPRLFKRALRKSEAAHHAPRGWWFSLVENIAKSPRFLLFTDIP